MNEFVGVSAGKPAVCRAAWTEAEEGTETEAEAGVKQPACWPLGLGLRLISQGYMSVTKR